jgi:hypothetical protein
VKRQHWQSLTGTLDGAGAITLSLGPVPLNDRWGIQRIATIGAGAANPTLTLYRNIVSDGYAIEGTSGGSGNRDFSDENSWLIVDEGEVLLLRYTGGTAAATVTVNIGYVKEEIRPTRRTRRRRLHPDSRGFSSWDEGGRRPLAGQHPTSSG